MNSIKRPLPVTRPVHPCLLFYWLILQPFLTLIGQSNCKSVSGRDPRERRKRATPLFPPMPHSLLTTPPSPTPWRRAGLLSLSSESSSCQSANSSHPPRHPIGRVEPPLSGSGRSGCRSPPVAPPPPPSPPRGRQVRLPSSAKVCVKCLRSPDVMSGK